jgi:hypothetical protein
MEHCVSLLLARAMQNSVQMNSNAENMMMSLYIKGTKVPGAEGAKKWNNLRLFSPYDPSLREPMSCKNILYCVSVGH